MTASEMGRLRGIMQSKNCNSRLPKPPYSEKLIQSTLDHWGPLYKEKEGKELTRADAEEILTNLFGYFEVLARIDEQQNAGKKIANSVE